MIKFLSLSSGSSGNCYFFTDGKVSFLIDAGVGPRVCAKKLSENGFSLRQVDFILVTHDHIDHIKALGIISSKYSKPIYSTEILKNAYRYSVQEDILFCLENNDLTAKQCYALLSLPNPLAAVYEKWEASDHRLLNHLMDTIRATANEKLRQDYIRLRREAR